VKKEEQCLVQEKERNPVMFSWGGRKLLRRRMEKGSCKE